MEPFSADLDHWQFAGKELIGRVLVDPDEHHIGTVREVFLDADTDVLEWVDVAVPPEGDAGTFSLEEESGRFVPAAGVELLDDGRARCRWSRDHVLASPVEARDLSVTRVEEDQLYGHYGLDYPREWINNGLPGGATMTGTTGIVPDQD